MTPDQVEDAGWSQETWESLNELARRTVEEYAQVRKLIPRGPDAPNAYYVEVSSIQSDPNSGQFSFTVPTPTRPLTCKVNFVIAPDQLHDIPRIRLLVQRVATRLAQAEDAMIHAVAAKEAVDTTRRHGQPPEPLVETFARGAAAVRTRGLAGTLNAILGAELWTVLALKDIGGRMPGAERLKHALGSAKAELAYLSPENATTRAGLVLAPQPGAIDVVWTAHPRITHLSIAEGALNLRLEESFCVRVLDGNALQRVEFPE